MNDSIDNQTETKTERDAKFLDISVAIPALAGDGWRARITYGLEKMLGYIRIRRLFAQATASSGDHIHCTDRVLQMLNITVDHTGVADVIPKQGGAIVIANHPFGGADAISLCSLCCNNRKDSNDAKILANSIVSKGTKFSEFLLPLKILNEKNAKRHNLMTLKSASTLVKNGGLLGVFPAGAVSRYRRDKSFEFADAEWSEHIARIALKTKAPVIPIRYFGKTPLWFNFIGMIFPLLRAALIPRMLLFMQGQVIKCRAGKAITYDELNAAENPTEYIRKAVYSISL